MVRAGVVPWPRQGADVGDLRYIARDLGLRNVRIFGRNWLGRASRRSWVRALTPMADRVLRPFPCSAGHSLGAQMSLPANH